MEPEHLCKVQGADDVSVEHKKISDDVLLSIFYCPTCPQRFWFFVDDDGLAEVMAAEVLLDLFPSVVHRKNDSIDLLW